MSSQLRRLVLTGIRGTKTFSARNLQFTQRAAPISFVNYRSFGSHSTGKPEPFLDQKEVVERIIGVLKNFEKVNASKVTATSRFKEDLDLDSLDAVEVVMAIEEEFGLEIPDSEADKILSVTDAVAYISAHPMAK